MNSQICQQWLPSVEDGTVIRWGPSMPFWYNWDRKAIAWIVFPKPWKGKEGRKEVPRVKRTDVIEHLSYNQLLFGIAINTFQSWATFVVVNLNVVNIRSNLCRKSHVASPSHRPGCRSVCARAEAAATLDQSADRASVGTWTRTDKQLPKPFGINKSNMKHFNWAKLAARAEYCGLKWVYFNVDFYSLAIENARLLQGCCTSLHYHGDLFDHFRGNALTFGHKPQDDFSLSEDDFTAHQ